MLRFPRRLVLLGACVLVAAAGFAACAEEEEADTASPTAATARTATPAATKTPQAGATQTPATTPEPTPTPQATPAGETGGFDGFRAFAQEIEAALEDKDPQFFIQRARLTEMKCTGEEFPLPCAGQPAGTTVTGILSTVWNSDAAGLPSPEEYAQWLRSYFDGARGDLSDDYGSGSVVLYALAQSVREGNEVFGAVATAMVDTYPSGTPLGETRREARVFRFQFENGQWRFTGETVHYPYPDFPEWLSDKCAGCYTRWERWE